jgi:N-acetylmuramoyl-L-alanine amidase
MTRLVAALIAAWAAAPPAAVIIATPRGETAVPVLVEQGMPVLAAARLVGPLGLGTRVSGASVVVTLGGLEFALELGSPFARAGGVVYPMIGAPFRARDTLFLPLAWLADAVPRAGAGRYRWIAGAARLEVTAAADSAAAVVAAAATAPAGTAPPAGSAAGRSTPTVERPPHPVSGLRGHYVVVVDPGHGGRDPGNPGRYLPTGMTEKDVTLAIGRQVRAELVRRGIEVRLTRLRDTLIDLGDRGAACRAACDLFVSIHVNAMPRGRRQAIPGGVETYILSEAKTEDQARVAAMENDAIRFETDVALDDGDLGFILRDLQQNEYLRESARLAGMVQEELAGVHPGKDRGVQQAGFVVLNTAGRPAILVETGFATNKQDGAFIGSALGQRKIAQAIAAGIVAYFQDYERKSAGVQGATR